MTFDEWIEANERASGKWYSKEERRLMRLAWDASRDEVTQSPTYAPKPAGKHDCRPFDAQEEIGKLRKELNEIRSSLEMLKAPVHVVDVPYTPHAPKRKYKLTFPGYAPSEIEPEVSAGEGFNIHYRQEPDQSMATFLEGEEWRERLRKAHKEQADKVTDFHNWRNSKPKFPGY